MTFKYIVGLEGHGRLFKMHLRNLGISAVPRYHESGARCDLDFVYNESASQMLLIYDQDTQKFLVRLMQLPQINFFKHLDQFSDPTFVMHFTSCFREFALGILFEINRKLGYRSDVDYLLEAIDDDYMIVFQAFKGN